MAFQKADILSCYSSTDGIGTSFYPQHPAGQGIEQNLTELSPQARPYSINFPCPGAVLEDFSWLVAWAPTPPPAPRQMHYKGGNASQTECLLMCQEPCCSLPARPRG